MKLISWNPSNYAQFAHLIPNQQLSVLDVIVDDGKRKVVTTEIISSENISCFEWQYVQQNSLLAYGTTAGAVVVLNSANSTQTILPFHHPKRPCHQVAWNYLHPNKLSVGFDSIKSNDSCIVVCDLETQRSLRIPSNESCCSLNFLPQHESLLFAGNSMGWVKLFDLRTANHAPVLSWLSHPANRPRKVKGLCPCFLDGNIIATYSDAVGDTVKIWDLRLIEGKTAKKGGLPRGFSVNPYHYSHDEYNNSIVTSASINDVSWSPSRTDIIAVATSNSKSILFFKYDSGKMDTTVHLETTFPVSVINTTDPAKSLSWQWIDSENLSVSRPSIIESINRAFEKQTEVNHSPSIFSTSSSPAAVANWEGLQLEPLHYTNGFKYHLQRSILSEAPFLTKKLLAITASALIETDVRDVAPFAFSEQNLIIQSEKGLQVFKSEFLEHRSSPFEETTFSGIESYLADITSLMKDRAVAGYSYDASANLDIFAEEIEFLSKKIVALHDPDISVDVIQTNVSKQLHKIQEIQRVWIWIDRLETSAQATRLSILNCGVLSSFKRSAYQSESMIDLSTGAVIFSSEIRSQIRKICGWLTLAEHDPDHGERYGSEPSRGKASDVESLVSSDPEAENKDLLELLVDDLSAVCFERAAVIALWHGDLNLAVQVLHDALDSTVPQHTSKMNDTHLLSSPTGSPDKSNNRDPDDDYMQVIALVASCIAGYYVKPTDDRADFPHLVQGWNNFKGNAFRQDRSSWKSACIFAMNKLKKFRRSSVSYLLAACHFLLANADEDRSDVRFQLFQSIFEDERIFLEDKISFAVTYLNDQELLAWMSSCYEDQLRTGCLEGLLFSGLDKDGLSLLQRYLDQTSDIQSVALITSRMLCAGAPTASNHANPSSLQPLAKTDPEYTYLEIVTKWIYCYRQLLIRWELYNERAHLDIEISQKIQKNNEMKQRLSSRVPSSSSHLSLMAATQQPGISGPSIPVSRIKAGGTGKSQHLALPVFEGIFPHNMNDQLNFYYIKLKCNFCGQSLPADDLASKNMEALRTQKYIINCCSNCSKQLPRCYVCKLHVGALNPYVKVKQAALLHSTSTNPDGAQIKNHRINPASTKDSTPFGKGKHGTSQQHSHHQGGKLLDCAFDKWLLFCQRCRHGGHTLCLTRWFAADAATEISEPNPEADKVTRIGTRGQVCGVNGCDCECQIVV